MSYSFEYRYEKQDFIDLNRVSRKAMMPKGKKLLTRLIRLIAVIVGIFGMFVGVGMFLIGEGDVMMVFLIFLSLLLLTRPLWSDRLDGNLSKSLTMRAEGLQRIVFEAEGIRDSVDEIETFYPYSALQSILRYKDRYYLFVDKNKAIILPRRGILEGDFEAIGPWLEEKTGKPVQVLKKV